MNFNKFLKYVAHPNTFVIAFIVVFIGIVFVFVASNNQESGIKNYELGMGDENQQLTNLEELKEKERELGERHRILAEARGTLEPGETKEVIKLRNETSKTYVSGEEKIIWEGTIGPIHYQDNPNNPNGEWKEIDTTIEEIEGQYQVTTTPYKATFLTQPGYIYQSKEVKGDWIQVKLESLESWDSGSKVIKNNKITYPNVFTDTDAEITAGNTGVQFNLILQSPQAPTQFSFDIESGNPPKNGLNWQSFSMRDLTGYDAEGKPLNIDWDFNQDTGKIALAVDTTDAVYPLTIDPTVEEQVGAGADDGRAGSNFSTSEPHQIIGYDVFDQYHMWARWTGVTYEGTVDVSYIELRGYPDGGGAPELKVYGVDEDNPPAPTTQGEFDADPLTSAGDPGINWDRLFTANEWNQSPLLDSIFQELVDTHGPFTNTAVMVQVRDDKGTGANSNRIFFWEYAGNLLGAKLHIEYTLKALGESCSLDGECDSGNCQHDVCCKDTCIDDCHCWGGQVGAGADDGYWSGGVYFFIAGAYPSFCYSTTYDNAFRWDEIALDGGETITNATISVYGYETGGAQNLKIQGINEADTATFYYNGDGDPRERDLTDAVDWDVSIILDWNESSDISDIITAIIGLGGWSSGNALGAFIQYREGPARQTKIYHWNGDTSKAAKLYIEYTPAAAGEDTRTYEGVKLEGVKIE